LNPGTAITDQTLRNNADAILVYLRDRGFFNAEVSYTTRPTTSDTEVNVTFQVTPNAQARVETFAIKVEGFDAAQIRRKIKLQPGEFYTRERVAEDVERIRKALREENFLAPELKDAQVVFDPDKNVVNIEVEGKVGATVNVTVEAGEEKIGDKKLTELLSVKREGTLDYASIIEGERRLRNYFQEKGFFFADVTAVCSSDRNLPKTRRARRRTKPMFYAAR
jgi:outer membrane protein assembly factor BamA